MENLVKNAVVIAEDEIDHSRVHVGSTVKLLDEEMNEEIEFSIVGSAEVNSLEHKISNESPLGRELVGRGVGDEFELDCMGIAVKYKIIDVTRE